MAVNINSIKMYSYTLKLFHEDRGEAKTLSDVTAFEDCMIISQFHLATKQLISLLSKLHLFSTTYHLFRVVFPSKFYIYYSSKHS